MADMKITLDDLKDRRKLVEKRKQGRLVDKPLKTTRSKRVNAGDDIDPTGSSILGMSRLFLGITTSIQPEVLIERYEKLMTEGLSGILFDTGVEGFADILPTEGFTDLLTEGVLGDIRPANEVSGDPSGITRLAEGEVGYTETGDNHNKYAPHVGHIQKRPWSMTFLAYLFKSLEIDDRVVSYANPHDAYRLAKESQRVGDSPKVGSIVFYSFNSSEANQVNHSGLVTSVADNGKSFVAIEGNTWSDEAGGPQQDGTGVHSRTRQTAEATVVGFYYPDYRSREEQFLALREKAVGRKSGDASSGETPTFSEASGVLSGKGFINPLDTMNKTSGFGPRGSPGGIGSSNHKGIDLGIPQGSPVKAVKAGKVIHAKSQSGGGGYGYYIKIDHGNGLETRYAHLSRFQVSPGDQVSQGQIIALSGGAAGVTGSGSSTGPHLHFEVRVNGNPQNPDNYLDY